VPSIGGFEGFDLTNPRGRFDGERFHLVCPKLGLGDAILSHTILVRFHISEGGFYTNHRHRKRRRPHHWGFPTRGGAPFLERDSLKVISRAFGDSIT
jgi:hypothetical protein